MYCYVPSLIHDERRWGSFVDVKVNAPQVLEKETRNLEKRVVFLSSATDPYQAVEARYEITRRCLEVLMKKRFPVSVLTRSPLVLRDLDLLKRFEWVRVGFSISTVPDRFFEPGVAPLERRIECLRRLRSEGIRTWVSLAPVIPQLILLDLDLLLSKLAEARVSAVFPGLIRFETYQESERNFERATGASSSAVTKDGEATLKTVRSLIREHGLEDSSSILDWSGGKETSELDSFMRA